MYGRKVGVQQNQKKLSKQYSLKRNSIDNQQFKYLKRTNMSETHVAQVDGIIDK